MFTTPIGFIVFSEQPTIKVKNLWTNGKIYTESGNLGFKAEKQLQNENHTEDWALGNHPRDNGHVTH